MSSQSQNPKHQHQTEYTVEQEQELTDDFSDTANNGNGFIDALWKFQELLRTQAEGLGDYLMGDSPLRTNTPPPPPLEKPPPRRVTHRRELFENTLHTHYSTFLPDHVAVPPMLNVQRSILPSVKESWIDATSGCVLFQEDGSAYWTYHWCPQSYITQVHLAPTKTDNGVTTQYKAVHINKLGAFDPIAAAAAISKTGNAVTQKWDTIVDVGDEVEYYTNGDYCYPSQDKRLRFKTKRETAVIFETCDDVNEPTIVKVVESTPCQYTVRVCIAPNDGDNDNHEDEDQEEDDASEEPVMHSTVHTEDEENVPMDDIGNREHLQLVEDIQKVTAAYAKTTGVDQVDMEEPDRATSLHDALPPFPPSRRHANLELVRDMFTHAYDSYMYNAYPASEVKPLTCRPGTFDLVKLPALTLIDTLDTLVIMQNYTEFARGVERLRDLHKSMQEVDYQGQTTHILRGGIFSTNANVSLFETNIRVMGGLLSAHQLAVAYLEGQVLKEHVRDSKGTVLIGPIVVQALERPEMPTLEKRDDKICSLKDAEEDICKISRSTLQGCIQSRDGTCESNLKGAAKNTTTSKFSSATHWAYDGFLLELAHDLGKRMVPAFQTKTGIPYGTVNLVDGIPNGESKVASLAGAGTLSLEFELLSRLTGDESFGQEAKLASRALWMRRSKKDLLGKHIHIERGGWTETLSGIGSNSDSFYEYLVKHYILFPEDADFWQMFLTSYYGVYNESRIGEWYADVDMNNGNSGASRRVFESLMAFYPGMQVLIGELGPAAKTLNGFFMVREALGLLPERFNYGGWKVDGTGAGLHPLRPELLESCYFLHKSTQGVPLRRPNAVNEYGSSGWLWAADYALHSIHWHTWAPCGYSAVSGVSPQTTGGIPGSQAKNRGPQAVNEMPSFFLSETLKYLYLMYDEDNLLHRDLDRQWVFTTEAHPIHNEPAVQASSGSSDPEASKHRQRLREMLTKRGGTWSKRRAKSEERRPEKWAEKSVKADFMRQLSETLVNNAQAQPMCACKGSELFDIDIFQPSFLPIVIDGDEFSSSQQDDSNIAHLSLSPSGVGMQPLAKACVNIYSPSLSWVNALNGGAVDYSNVYVSSIHDEIPIDTRYGVGLLSASRALALLGTGLFLGKDPANEDNSCPASLRPPRKKRETNSMVQRFDMGGHLGEFEVSVYVDGNGFSIKRLVSGETVVATVVHHENSSDADDEENTRPYVMLYASTTPPTEVLVSTPNQSQSWLPDMNWKSVFSRAGSSTYNDSTSTAQETTTERSVIVGDASGASFSCDLQILRRKQHAENMLNFAKDGDDTYVVETEEIVKSFPCAPGLFGPTRIPNLVKSGGLFVEGELAPPDPGNEDGCTAMERAEEIDGKERVRMVNRGRCTFQTKVRNQKLSGASAVIVVNSMRNPQELFLMAPGNDPDTCDDDFVATILVSGGDGAEILRLVDENNQGTLVAKVLVAPQRMVMDESGTMLAADGSADIRFPLLIASSDAIQVFAAGGWGVHAVGHPHDSGADEGNREWQLFLLQHSHVPGD